MNTQADADSYVRKGTGIQIQPQAGRYTHRDVKQQFGKDGETDGRMETVTQRERKRDGERQTDIQTHR